MTNSKLKTTENFDNLELEVLNLNIIAYLLTISKYNKSNNWINEPLLAEGKENSENWLIDQLINTSTKISDLIYK